MKKSEGSMINVGAFIPESRVNGPGLRSVLWVRGCPFRCPGCFNPEFQDFDNARLETVETIVRWILYEPNTEGVTFTGGEPFSQAKALSKAAAAVRREGKSVVIFTGYEKNVLMNSGDIGHLSLIEQADMLIAGPFEKDRPSEHPLLASANQDLVFLTERYRDFDFSQRGKKGEIRIKPDGKIEITGLVEMVYQNR